MVLEHFSAGRPTNVDYSRARAYCASNRCGCFDFFSLSPTISHFFLPLCVTWLDTD